MKLLITGGSGRLGSELQLLLPSIVAPSSQELDITNKASISAAIEKYNPDVFLHAAAFTDVSGGEKRLNECWQCNVQGTKNIVDVLGDSKIKLIHISTDYVFSGDDGNYSEKDNMGPALNFYALSKIVAERYVLSFKNSLVIRTSFRPRQWDYPNAFIDMFTSQDYVDIIAAELVAIIKNSDAVDSKVLHIATERKSVFELASRRSDTVNKASKSSVSVKLPNDVSLNCSLWHAIKEGIR